MPEPISLRPPQSAPAALVTGGARRIGAALARRLAKEGFRVAIHHNASSAEARALAEEIRESGGHCVTVAGDLGNEAGTRAVWAQTIAALGPVSLLVNNASLFRNDDLPDFRSADLSAHMAVNLQAPLRLTDLMAAQAALPAGALVVNMLDNKVFAPNPDFFTYTLSKAALRNATEISAMRLCGRPRVCGIAPSITLPSGAQTEADFEATARINPLGCRVFPEDIAEALLYLWHDPAMNGEILTIDGGQSLWNLPRDVAFLDPKDRPDA